MDIDLEELAAMVGILKEMDFSEFRYEKGELRIEIRRGGPADGIAGEVGGTTPSARPVAVMAASAAAASAAPTAGIPTAPPARVADGAQPVVAPLLGTFYGQPKPGEAPFVAVGDRVEPDTVVCIIEVMKLMNSVVAGVRGVVSAVHASDGELVEHGQILFSVMPVAD